MFCKNCGNQIDDDAKFCHGCGASTEEPIDHPVVEKIPVSSPASRTVQPKAPEKKKGMGCLSVIGIILAIFLFFIFIGIIMGEEEPEKVGDSGSPSSSTSASETGPAPFTVGDKVELNDVIVTLVSVSESTGSEYITPSDGNIFVICEFEIENNSTADIAVSSLLSFEAYFDDYTTQMSLSATVSSDVAQLDGTVAAGKKMRGVIGYEVAQGWNSLDIRFTPDFWTGKDIIFVYESDS